MSIPDYKAIDVHAHYGNYITSIHELTNRFMTADMQTVVNRARSVNIDLTIMSPIEAMNLGGDGNVLAPNDETSRLVQSIEGALQWVVVNPLCPSSYNQAAKMLKDPKCVGIKIHPVMHNYNFTDYGMDLIRFAAEQHTVVQSHCGEDPCLPKHFVEAADEFPEVPIIMAHLGLTFDDDYSYHVRAMQKSKHGNLYADTSSGSSVVANMVEWAVSEVGADHILFGSDAPLYDSPMYRARIDFAEISDEDKRLVLRENAERLFKLTPQS